MKVGFFYSDPTKQVKKNYPYHGRNWQCWEPPDPAPFDDDHYLSEDGWFVFTGDYFGLTNKSVTFKGELQVVGDARFIMRGFEYGPSDGSWYLIVYELGDFTNCFYELFANIGD